MANNDEPELPPIEYLQFDKSEENATRRNKRTRIIESLLLAAILLTSNSSSLGPENDKSISAQIPAPIPFPDSTTSPDQIPLPEPNILPTQTPLPESTITSAPEQPKKSVEVQAYPNNLFASEALWSQNFAEMPNGPIDKNFWNVLEGPPPVTQEYEYYTNNPDNLRIENGALILEAKKESVEGRNYTSARIDTLGKEDFMYGKVEVTAKLPTGVGTWPAIWLMSSDNKYSGFPIPAGTNPYAVNGEIDMAEVTGTDANNIYGIVHSLIHPDNSSYPKKYYATLKVPDSSTAFHTYGVDWTPSNITFRVDGIAFYSVEKKANYDYTRWPFDQRFHLIINLAIGGANWVVDHKAFPTDGVNPSALPAKMEVQKVSLFTYNGPTG